MKKTIRVRAGQGLIMPIHPGIAMDTTERFFTPEVVVEVVADDRFVRRCLKNGDLVEVKESPAAADDASRPPAIQVRPLKKDKE